MVLVLLPCLPGGLVHAQSVIDVAVFYTTAAKDDEGGTDQIKTKIDEMVAATNLAYADSGANQTIKLVHVGEVAYTASDRLSTDRSRLENPSDGHMDEVHATRDRVWADIVILLRRPGDVGGVASLMHTLSTDHAAEAFAVSTVHAGNFMHELGHIMGLAHDRYEACSHDTSNPQCPTLVTPYAYGYVNQEAFESGASSSKRWRTIMSYSNQCDDAGVSCSPSLLRFSNPNKTYRGDPMGAAGTQFTNDLDGPVDAARTLNDTRRTVANFRQGRAVQVSFGSATYAATEGGRALVAVKLNTAPGRELVIPLTARSTDGAWSGDYSLPTSVTFSSTAVRKTFIFEVTDDAIDERAETVELGFGLPLPGGVTVGSQDSATVTLRDNDPATTAAPHISTVALSSDPGPDGVYSVGDQIEVTVVFTKPVTVTGTPVLALTVGTDTRQVLCRDAASETLTCADSVPLGASDADGVSIAANSLRRAGATIRDADNQNASLTHAAVAADSGHAVDAVKPVLQTATVDGGTVKLTYNEALDETSVPTADAFTVSVGGTTRPVDSIQISGQVVTLTVVSWIRADRLVRLRYRLHGRDFIQDVPGNLALAFSNQAVQNLTPQPVYDTDADGLIAITTWAQLDAIRHDPDGDGIPMDSGAVVYADAFSDATRVVCDTSSSRCEGYELTADLDFFDTNADGQVDTNDDTNADGQVDAEDTAYWNDGAGWQPISSRDFAFQARFEGNGHTLRHLFVNRDTDAVGLFGWIGINCVIRHVGLIDGVVTGNNDVGGLVGGNGGTITASYATGRVSGRSQVGGLVGSVTRDGAITAGYATGRVSGRERVGGLVGSSDGAITASYATGRVSGRERVGGLVGIVAPNGTITASYATGRVSGRSRVEGLVGSSDGTITASYWDTATSGWSSGSHGAGQTTVQLQTPTGYSGLYADWNVDLDDDGTDDDPWHFGSGSQYPALRVDFDGDETASWQELGQQLRAGPTLTVTTETGPMELSWTAADVSDWNPAPDVTYTVYRNTGSTPVAEDLSAREYTDLDVTSGTTYTYQVAAVVDGGEVTRSGLVKVTAPNQPPMFDDGTSTTRTITENTPANRNIGAQVAATDPDGDQSTYSLGGPDADFFTINTSTGQVRTKAALDYETQDTYEVTVAVRDSQDVDGTPDMATDDEIDVTITVTDVNEAPVFDASLPTTYRAAENTPRGQRIEVFSAMDPDTLTPDYADLTYSLSGTDAAVFFLDPITGELQTREPLDYESRSAYQVTVAVRDGRDADGVEDLTETDAELAVTISVLNVDEAGMVALSSSLPQEKRALTATLSDLDGGLNAITWQWARSPDQTTWTDIPGAMSSGALTATYTPGATDVGQYLRARAMYTDGHSMGKAAQAVTGTAVQAAPQVRLVLSPDASIAESGTGNTVSVTAELMPAAEDETTVKLSEMREHYTLSGATLTIPSGATQSNAVILTATDNAVDGPEETKAIPVTGILTKSLLVTAPDAATLRITDDDTRGVMVTPTELTVEEGSSEDYEVVLTSAPTEPVTVTVTAPTNPDVTVNRTELVFQPGGWNTAQPVTVAAAQDSTADDEPATITHTVSGGDYTGESVEPVAVTVEDDEGPSTAVVLSVQPPTVGEGSSRTVTVRGALNRASRQQATPVEVDVTAGTATQGTDFTAIAPFTLTIPAETKSGTATFTLAPVDDSLDEPDETVTVSGSTIVGLDVTETLVTITDTDAPPTMTLVLTPDAIGEDGGQSTVTATLSHPSSAATEVAVVVTAGADAVRQSGTALTIAAGETASTGTATLTAVDNSTDAQDTLVTVSGQADNALAVNGPAAATLTITDDDPPEVEGESAPMYVEGGTGPVATYTASNPANVRLTWSVTGPDADAFTISNGVLRFKQSPDYEEPADANADNEYDITVQASDRTLTGELPVLVTVQDAPGTVRLSPAQPRIVSPLRATLRDPDGVETVAEWCWERSRYRDFQTDSSLLACTVTDSAAATYQPEEGDLGHYLRATATYTDGHGATNKTAAAATTTTVSIRSPPSQGGGGSSGGSGDGSGGGGSGQSQEAPTGYLENPGVNSYQSGIGVISGWVCAADTVEIALNGVRQEAAYGTERLDTLEVCGDADNGFGLLFNWNLLGDGAHEVAVYVDGIELGRATVTVTTLGEEFVRGVSGECTVGDFPSAGEGVWLVWQEAQQNFVLAEGVAPTGPQQAGTAGVGYLENPSPHSFQSGIGVISGWVCEAEEVVITLGDLAPQAAGYGTERLDTRDVCGDTDNGFGLLFNWNLLGDGEHVVVAVVDDVELGRTTVRVTTLGEEFVRGAEGECTVPDFPSPGERVTLTWQQNSQNFVVTGVE